MSVAATLTRNESPAQHLPAPVVGLNRTRGDWTAHLADGRTAPISEKRARALLAGATVVDYWTFGIYANWCIRGG